MRLPDFQNNKVVKHLLSPLDWVSMALARARIAMCPASPSSPPPPNAMFPGELANNNFGGGLNRNFP